MEYISIKSAYVERSINNKTAFRTSILINLSHVTTIEVYDTDNGNTIAAGIFVTSGMRQFLGLGVQVETNSIYVYNILKDSAVYCLLIAPENKTRKNKNKK